MKEYGIVIGNIIKNKTSNNNNYILFFINNLGDFCILLKAITQIRAPPSLGRLTEIETKGAYLQSFYVLSKIIDS